jgi:hypothetical protein
MVVETIWPSPGRQPDVLARSTVQGSAKCNKCQNLRIETGVKDRLVDLVSRTTGNRARGSCGDFKRNKIVACNNGVQIRVCRQGPRTFRKPHCCRAQLLPPRPPIQNASQRPPQWMSQLVITLQLSRTCSERPLAKPASPSLCQPQ